MKELVKRKELIITSGDKCGTVVLMETYAATSKKPINNYLTKQDANN